MSDNVWIGLFAAVPPTITSILAWRNAKKAQIAAVAAKVETASIKADVRGVHDTFNGRMKDLMDEIRSSAHAKGVKDEKARRDAEDEP